MSAATPPAFVLGSGINALGIVRSLGRKGVPVHLFTTSEDDLARRSRLLASVTSVDSKDPDATAALIQERARALGERPALFFTTDKNLLLVSSRRDELAELFRLQLPPSRSVTTVTDKAEFGRWTQEQGFPVPRTFSPQSLPEVEAVAATARFPVVLKPTVSFTWAGKGMKMVRADDRAALLFNWKKLQALGGALLVQEYIDAPDDQHYAYYSYRTPERGELVHVTVQKLRVHPVHGGAGAFLQVVHEPEMEAVGRAILERLDYTGIASVCFKKAAGTGQPFIYEINGRMPQCHTAFRIPRVDLPYLMYRDMIGDPIEAPPHRQARGRWTSLSLDISAFLGYRKRGELGLLRWLSSYAGVRTCAEFAWDDPAPLFDFLRVLVRHVVQRRAPRDTSEAPPHASSASTPKSGSETLTG